MLRTVVTIIIGAMTGAIVVKVAREFKDFIIFSGSREARRWRKHPEEFFEDVLSDEELGRPCLPNVVVRLNDDGTRSVMLA